MSLDLTSASRQIQNMAQNISARESDRIKRIEAAMIGVKEIAVPVTTSTITTIAAFFPLIFMPGIAGEFIKFLPLTLIITLSSSLFVAMLINPVLCSTLMRVKTKKGITPDFDELKLIDKSLILRGYRSILGGVLKWRFSLLLVFMVLFFGTFYLYGTETFPRKGLEFFPKNEYRNSTL